MTSKDTERERMNINMKERNLETPYRMKTLSKYESLVGIFQTA